ncbi:MAG: hypothetical protein ACREFF_07235 [Candidatus Udaeobacter sp.]
MTRNQIFTTKDTENTKQFFDLHFPEFPLRLAAASKLGTHSTTDFVIFVI